MLVEIGVQRVAKALAFETAQTADEVNAQVDAALKNNETLKLTDTKGRTYIVPRENLAYVIVGSQASHPVGFGAL
ncbi:DUF3107 domain-containing protein [Alloscardovia omnicolens]|uniref:DUF3107 domain-containing protein n=1 Tax=Alloscardovia omnicolens TaxID=419015 RepID=UPI003A7A0981